MRGQNMLKQGFGGSGYGRGYRAGNPNPYCRNNPSLPSRRAMAMKEMGNTVFNGLSESEYLKNTAIWLNSQLEAVNKRLSELG